MANKYKKITIVCDGIRYKSVPDFVRHHPHTNKNGLHACIAANATNKNKMTINYKGYNLDITFTKPSKAKSDAAKAREYEKKQKQKNDVQKS